MDCCHSEVAAKLFLLVLMAAAWLGMPCSRFPKLFVVFLVLFILFFRQIAVLIKLFIVLILFDFVVVILEFVGNRIQGHGVSLRNLQFGFAFRTAENFSFLNFVFVHVD